MYFQNFANTDMYCLGTFSCGVYNTNLVFLVKFFYIIFWTWLLNLICDQASPTWSWFLVIFPFFMMFGFIALMFINNLSTRFQDFSVGKMFTPTRSWGEYFDYFFSLNSVENPISYVNPFSYVPSYLKPS